MKMQLIISVCFFVVSIFLFLALFVTPFLRKNHLLRKFIRICTLLYVTGTLLITLVTVFMPTAPLTWVWLSESFVFAIFAASSGMIFYVVTKFKQSVDSADDDTKQ